VDVAGLRYVICFCRCGERVLMLHRDRPPNRHRWNGVGGKLEPGERPLACARREVLEETGIALDAAALRFAGIVTWDVGADETLPSTGMYAFVAALPAGWPVWAGERDTPEGRLAWLPVARVCGLDGDGVVTNIPHFLPAMLDGAAPREYRCHYRDGRLVRVTTHPCDLLP
jgi:8-oxo-dGTP diphosphatase